MSSTASFGEIAGNRGKAREHNDGRSGQRRPLVMVVDDQSTGRRILQELVGGLDPLIQVEAFEDPLVALEYASERTPDLVITDYKMPFVDGIEFTRRFRMISGCQEVPLMVITVVEDRRVRYEALEAGATDFITRPLDHHECRARCRNLLTMRAQQRTIQDRAQWLERQVSLATSEIRKRERETLLRLAKAGEYRDEGTGNHILRMARYSRLLAEAMGLDEVECDTIEIAAPMHDIGKIGIPDSILLKPGELTTHETRVMQKHTEIGFQILRGSPSRYLQEGAEIALGHHERFDGSGYPYGHRGEEIPIAARIVAVADVFDALTTERPYKHAWISEDAVAYIREQSGRHFDPACVSAFMERLEEILEIRSRLCDSINSSPTRDIKGST